MKARFLVVVAMAFVLVACGSRAPVVERGQQASFEPTPFPPFGGSGNGSGGGWCAECDADNPCGDGESCDIFILEDSSSIHCCMPDGSDTPPPCDPCGVGGACCNEGESCTWDGTEHSCEEQTTDNFCLPNQVDCGTTCCAPEETCIDTGALIGCCPDGYTAADDGTCYPAAGDYCGGGLSCPANTECCEVPAPGGGDGSGSGEGATTTACCPYETMPA